MNTLASQRPIRSFVLRQGRLSTAQARAIEQLYPIHGILFDKSVLDLNRIYGRQAPKIIEIGFGMGQATAHIAATCPENDYLGIEVHSPGVGSLLNLIEQHQIRNLRIVQHDAVEVLAHMIADASLHGIHIFFPDPWHKARHHKRRLIQADFIALLCSKLVPGGYLHCATDWEPYAGHILTVLNNTTGLVNTADNYAPRPSYRPLTKFEQRGLNLGHGIRDIVFHKARHSTDISIS